MTYARNFKVVLVKTSQIWKEGKYASIGEWIKCGVLYNLIVLHSTYILLVHTAWIALTDMAQERRRKLKSACVRCF
jgi:hypothetical protein